MSESEQDPSQPADDGSPPPPVSGTSEPGLPPPPGGSPAGVPPPPPGGQWAAPASGAAFMPPGGSPLADPWARVGARVIDAVIGFVISVVLVAAFVDGNGASDAFQSDADGGFLLASIVAGVAYEVGFVGALGGTPGKLMLGLRVVTQESGTTPPGWDKAGLRYLPSLVGLVPFIGWFASMAVAVASLVWIFSDDRRRSVFDRVAATYVVKV
jgi:uncharacterized RDD family membrane protein YckC